MRFSSRGNSNSLLHSLSLIVYLAILLVFFAIGISTMVIGSEDLVTSQLQPGNWGGEHIHMLITDTRVVFEFDCAFGAIEGRLAVDAAGKFSSLGTYTLEAGGPGYPGERPPSPTPSRYTGKTDGSKMELRVLLIESGQKIGPFLLELNRRPTLEKCL